MNLVETIALLGVTVTPGTILSVAQRLTRSLANLLGTPTVTLDAGDVTTAIIATRAVTPAKFSDEARSLLNGFKNRVINGNFNFLRRDPAVNNPATATFCFDRWRISYDGTVGTMNVGVIASNLVGYQILEDVSNQAMRWNQSVAGSGGTFRFIEQRIEDARTLAGVNATISFWGTITSGQDYIVELVRVYGTGGSPSVSETLFTQTIAGSAGWAKQELTFAIPNVWGKSFGTNGDSYLALRFRMPVNVVFDFYLSLVQLELGSVASAFEQRGNGVERLLCNRYFESSYTDGVYPDGNSNLGNSIMIGQTTGIALGYVIFGAQKRAIPTISVFAPAGGSGAGSVREGLSTVILAVVPSFIGTRAFSRIDKAASFTVNAFYDFHWTANAEL